MKKHFRWYVPLILLMLSGCVPAEAPMLTPTPTPEPLALLAELNGPAGNVFSLDWSPDGKTLLSGGFQQVTLWDMQTNTLLTSLPGPLNIVWGVAWSPDGTSLASVGLDGNIHHWSFPSLEPLTTRREEWGFSVAFSPDDSRLAVGSEAGKIYVYDLASDSPDAQLEMQTSSYSGIQVISLSWSPDGSKIAAGYLNGDIIIWDADTGLAQTTINDYTTARRDTNGLAWSPDGSILATAHQDGIIRVWQTKDFTLAHNFRGGYGWQRGLAWSPDGARIVAVGEDAIIRIFTSSGELLASKAYGNLPLWSVVWSPDGTRLAVGAGDYNAQSAPNSIYILAAP